MDAKRDMSETLEIVELGTVTDETKDNTGSAQFDDVYLNFSKEQ